MLSVSTCCELQEMDGEPAPVDKRSDDEVVRGSPAKLSALQQRSAASCSASAAPHSSPRTNTPAADSSQKVSMRAICDVSDVTVLAPMHWHTCS